MKIIRTVSTFVGVFIVVMLPTSAFASCNPMFGGGDDTDETHVGPTGSHQYAKWGLGDRHVRLKVTTGSGMSTNKCHSAVYDWAEYYSDHYDSRTMRSCKPGSVVESDPGGDGFWEEPGDWAGRQITGARIGAGYVMGDDYDDPDTGFDLVNFADMSQAQAPGCHFNAGGLLPRQSDLFTKIRTLYQNGQIAYNGANNDPARHGA